MYELFICMKVCGKRNARDLKTIMNFWKNASHVSTYVSHVWTHSKHVSTCIYHMSTHRINISYMWRPETHTQSTHQTNAIGFKTRQHVTTHTTYVSIHKQVSCIKTHVFHVESFLTFSKSFPKKNYAS